MRSGALPAAYVPRRAGSLPGGERGWSRVWRCILLLGLTWWFGGQVLGDEHSKREAGSLREAKIQDRPTTVSIPISAAERIVVALTEHHWILCESHTDRPMALDGEGVILESLVDSMGGAMAAILHVGVIPLAPSRVGEKQEDRVRRTAEGFVAALDAKYRHCRLRMLTEPSEVDLRPTTLKVGGEWVPAFRTSRYNTSARLLGRRVDTIFASECALVNLPGQETLVYLVHDSRVITATLDAAVRGLVVESRSAAGTVAGGIRQLIEVASIDGLSHPRRLVSFQAPTGFAPNFPARARDRVVFTEDRLDPSGRLTARYQLDWRARGLGRSLLEEGDAQRALLLLPPSAQPTVVSLGALPAGALIYTHAATLNDQACAATVGVFLLEDQVWTLTWWTRGDDALVAVDRLAVVALLGSLQLAVRPGG